MKFNKVCMNCANEFETDKLFDNNLICPKCLSGNIYQTNTYNYDEISMYECFILYHVNNIACECNANKKEVCLVEE